MSLRHTSSNTFDDVVVLDSPPAPIPPRNLVPSSTNYTQQASEVIDLDMSPTSSLDDLTPRKRRRRDAPSTTTPSAPPVIDLDAEDSPTNDTAANTRSNDNNTHNQPASPSTPPRPISADPMVRQHRPTLFSPLQAAAHRNSSMSDEIVETAAAGPRVSAVNAAVHPSLPDPSHVQPVERLSLDSNGSVELVNIMPTPRDVRPPAPSQQQRLRASMPSLVPPPVVRSSSIDPVTHRFAAGSMPSLRVSDTSMPRSASTSSGGPAAVPISPHVSPFVVSDTSPPRPRRHGPGGSVSAGTAHAFSDEPFTMHDIPLRENLPGYPHLISVSGAPAGPSSAIRSNRNTGVEYELLRGQRLQQQQRSMLNLQNAGQRGVRPSSAIEAMGANATTYIPPMTSWPRLTPPFMLETPVRRPHSSIRRSHRPAQPRRSASRAQTSVERDVPSQNNESMQTHRIVSDEMPPTSPEMLQATRGSVMQHMFGELSGAMAARANGYGPQRSVSRRGNGRGSRNMAWFAGSGSSVAGPSSVTHGVLHSFRPSNTSRRRATEASVSAPGTHRRRGAMHPTTQVHHFFVRDGELSGGLTEVHLRYLHSFSGLDQPLDYENLIRLDEQLLREKNRADKEQINSLPVQKASAEDKEIRCCVCMCDVEEGDSLRVLPCKHKYHKACIDGKFFHIPLDSVTAVRLVGGSPRYFSLFKHSSFERFYTEALRNGV